MKKRMANKEFIDKAVQIATNYLEAEGIHEPRAEIEKRAVQWSNQLSFSVEQRLAAAVIAGDYIPGTTEKEVGEIERFFFLEKNI